MTGVDDGACAEYYWDDWVAGSDYRTGSSYSSDVSSAANNSMSSADSGAESGAAAIGVAAVIEGTRAE